MITIKKIAAILLLTTVSASLFAQKQLNEGTLTYSITVTSTNKEAPLPPGFDNAKMVLYLKPQQSRNEFSTSLGSETNVYDTKAGKGFILKEFGTKYMITVEKADWELMSQKNKSIDFTISNETYNVAGVKCKKATGSIEAGKEMVIFFNPEIVPVNKTYHNAFPQLPGIPVQFEIQSGNITFKYTLVSIDENPVSSAKFATPQSGYRVMTFKENQQLKKGTGK